MLPRSKCNILEIKRKWEILIGNNNDDLYKKKIFLGRYINKILYYSMEDKKNKENKSLHVSPIGDVPPSIFSFFIFALFIMIWGRDREEYIEDVTDDKFRKSLS